MTEEHISEVRAEIADLLNAQTGKVSWPDLARHFARGVVVVVSAEADLVNTAQCLVSDRADEISRLSDTGDIHRALDEDAIRWQEENAEFWAVVVAPWVLVQEIARA